MHPADELFEVREQLRGLKAREAELRKALICAPRSEAREGERYRANVVLRFPRRLDAARLPEGWHEDPGQRSVATSHAVTLRETADDAVSGVAERYVLRRSVPFGVRAADIEAVRLRR